MNFQSMVGKKAETLELLDRMKPDILIGTETWLSSNISDGELLTKQYQIYRKDRCRNRWGGIIIAVRTDLQSTLVTDFDTNCECLWVKVITKTEKPVYVSAFYRSDVKDVKSLEEYQESLRKASRFKKAHFIIGGDFNLPSMDWPNMCLKPKASYVNSHNNFLEVLEDLSLHQLVLEPTRLGNVLDLIITNVPDLVPRVEVIPGLSDHSIVFIELKVKPDRKVNAPRQILLYKHAHWDDIKKDMLEFKNHLENGHNNKNVDELWQEFKNSLKTSIDKHIPKKTSKPRDSLPWIDPETRKLMNKRDKLSKLWKKTGITEIETKWHDTRREVRKRLDREHWKYVGGLFEPRDEEYDKQPCNKRFFTYVKHQRTTSIGIAPLKCDGKLITDPKTKAEILNTQFYKAFSDGKEFSEEEFTAKCTMPEESDSFKEMPEIHVTVEGVEKLLAGLDPNKAAGPDGLTPRILKELSKEIAPILTTIFERSLDSGTVPTEWKKALVSPVYKKGAHYDPINYRPISLTCICCKLLEHIVVSNMMTHLETENILCPEQHGFRRGHSCETQLLDFVEEIGDGLDSGMPSDIIVMDFAKAFDRVNHSLLTQKLKHYGIKGKTNAWIKDFLKDRLQAVVVEGVTSGDMSVRSGVPQGSVLGPSLFLIYINDLPSRVSSVSRLFADDTLLHNKIKENTDRLKLQEDLANLESWESEWEMKFHPDKCNVLPISRSRKTPEVKYTLHEQNLEQVTETKYLGVTIQSNLEWNKHIDSVCAKANKMLGLLRRNIKIAPIATKELGYKALVRPVLEYCSCVWDPHTQSNITKLEKIQRRAARFVLNRHKKTDSVDAMLRELKWDTLQERRKQARLNMLYKINNGLAKVRSKKLVKLPERAGRRGHGEMFQRIECKTNYRSESFLPKTIRDWNSLPETTVQAPSLGAFSARAAKR